MDVKFGFMLNATKLTLTLLRFLSTILAHCSAELYYFSEFSYFDIYVI